MASASRSRSGSTHTGSVPAITRVLAPTDFSELANDALRYAYALVRPGGTVYLLHVVEETSLPNPLYAHYTPGRRPSDEERAAQEEKLAEALRTLVPPGADRLGIESRVEIAHGGEPAEQILAAAERLRVDAICMGTHGCSGLAGVIAGSVTRNVASASRLPIFLVRTPSGD